MEANIQVVVTAGGRSFRFTLCRKQVEMGTVPVDHWWMRTSELYGQRAQKRRRGGGNVQAVTDCFWAMCREGESTGDPEVQESYLLAKILPHVRSQGSRRVFADANLGAHSRSQSLPEQLEILGHSVRGSQQTGMTREEFKQKTRTMLGPPELSPEQVAAYQEFTDDFLGRARAALARGHKKGVAWAVAEWQQLMKSVGRRAGHADRKWILDVVSYECRAALHRCYSAAWCLLLPQLQKKHGLSDESCAFLELWHADQMREREPGAPACWHLFHGHIFGLHPASGELLRVPAGRELVGAWLRDQGEEAFGRLLNGIYVAIHLYARRREEIAADRRKQPLSVGEAEEVEARKLDRKRGRVVRKRRRPDDS